MPATRLDIADVILKNKIPNLRSLVICFEDSINECDIPLALNNLQQLITQLKTDTTQKKPLIFIRPRHIEMATRLIKNLNSNSSLITGFVLPKFTQDTVEDWWHILKETSLYIMPTLETKEVFDANKMQALASLLAMHPCYSRIIALRIGGNDLMSALSLRRSRSLTLYDGPMGYIIKMLVAVFASKGFALTAPVCEIIDNHDILIKEFELDLHHGLVGKTAIHSNQINTIEQALKVPSADYNDAIQILNATQAVFKSQGAMCEPATHRHWAFALQQRAQVYGIDT